MPSMRLSQLATRATKAFRMVFGSANTRGRYGSYGGWTWGAEPHLPGTQTDWSARAGDLWLHETVAIALGWIERNLGQLELQVTKRTAAGKEEPLEDHPLLTLLRDPNPYHDGDDLAAAMALSWFCEGNAYVAKLRSGAGAPVELYWLPHWQVEPVGTATELITHYLYRVDNVEHRIERENLIHFRNGLNPRDPKRGQAEATACIRSIVGDTEWSNCIASLAMNMGLPPVVITPKSPEVDWDVDTATRIKAQYLRETTGDQRGKPIVIGSSVEIQKPGLSPEEMDVTTQRQWPQDSAVAVFGLSAMLLGLTAGANAKTYANMKEAREGGYEECLVPFLRKLARCLERQLLPDFGAAESLRVRYDGAKVPALQEDRTALFERTLSAWKERAIDRAETRAALGFEVRPEDEGLLYGDDKAPPGQPLWEGDPETGLPRNGTPSLGPAPRLPERRPALPATGSVTGKSLFAGVLPWWQDEEVSPAPAAPPTNGNGRTPAASS